MKTDYIGYGLAIVGIIVSYYFYIKSKRNKEPVYSIKSVNVISDYSSKYQALKVIYRGSKVENFTVTKILLYNRGAETITKQDIETINHLRIIGKDTTALLDAKILQANNASNNFDVFLDKEPYIEQKAKIYLIDFDYINKDQGAVIEVIHTGLTSADIVIVGDIIGVQNLTEVPPEKLITNVARTPSERRELGIAWILVVIGWGILKYGTDYSDSLIEGGNFLGRILGVVFALVLFFSAIAALVLFMTLVDYVTRPFYKGNEIPKGLEKFKE